VPTLIVVSTSSTISGPPFVSRAGRIWGETWRVLAAAAAGLILFAGVHYEVEIGDRIVRSQALVLLDVALGVLSLGLMLLRRRAPLTIALVLTLFGFVAALPVGAAAIATISLATRRRWREIAVVAVPGVTGSLVFNAVYPTTSNNAGLVDDAGRLLVSGWVVDVVVGVLGFALYVVIGAYIGTRRDLLRSLQERAIAAEREQARRTAQAQANERARIAREMHDVLAHRMSLVAMHAGALAYRDDLTPEQLREAATVIQGSAHAALEELRDVLGVLRGADGADGDGDSAAPSVARPERPQPTLGDLDDLLAEARAAGTDVRLRRDVPELGSLPTSTSRNAYRILQEALTNARKHARGARVTVDLHGRPGDGLTVVVSNPTLAPTSAQLTTMSASTPTAPTLPASGLGLAGLTERAELAGGHLTFGETGGRFELRAWLPWAT
jgi:signal transduction histidine kinase